LVDNSLGRLWLVNRPGSKLAEHMAYYIPPEKPETEFLKVNRPEDLKVCDPACGSGHMLTYAFDLLYAIYEEEGYEAAEIPEKILTHNLFGIELDERAGELAAFALTMKARARQRRFFNKRVRPNITVLEKVRFDHVELDEYMNAVGRDLFTLGLRETLQQFSEADNFGSLIKPQVGHVADALATLEAKDMAGNLFLAETHQRVLSVLRMAEALSPRYAVVVANPPYMGSKGMNTRLSAWAKENYPNSKSDLFAMFIERNLDFTVKSGAVAMITMQSWMFLSSFEALRGRILNQHTILSMAHLGARAFDSIGGEVVSTTAFVLENDHKPDYRGAYMRLVDGNSEAEKMEMMAKAISQGGAA
jgi:type II restriction/modification system DNA methylase subunit YeeA